MKPNLISDDKVIVTVAITGGIQGKWANPNIPITPEEQAQDALECYEAGLNWCCFWNTGFNCESHELKEQFKRFL